MTVNALVRLPFITDDLRHEFGSDLRLIDNDRQWTQEAVDFACEVASPAIRAEIERTEEAFRGVMKDNVGLAAEIEKLNARNAELERHAVRVDKLNAEQAAELKRLREPYTGKKQFTISALDAGSSAYRDEYVHWLESRLRPLCPGCGNEIDPEWCHCGSPITHSAWEGHAPVPMGCDCFREESGPC